MDIQKMSDEEFEAYKKVKDRIYELESKLDFLESDMPSRVVGQKIEATRLTLKANTELLKFLFGEGCLRQ